jgi:hypothetical protein
MEKSGINGEKFVRRTTRAWRLRRHRHIGYSCNYLELLAPHHARLLARSGAAAFGAAAFGRSTADDAASGPPAPPAPLLLLSACESVAVLRQAMRVCLLAAVLRPCGAASGGTGATQRGFWPHYGAGFIGRRRRLGRALYPPQRTRASQ